MEQNVTVAAVTAISAARIGPRPTTSRVLPHRQLDQLPTSVLMDELVARSLEIPLVQSKESRMASPGTCALWLADESAAGPAEAFIDAHEFCHIHPLPEGGIHLTLPDPFRQGIIRLGWGEPHPVSLSGILPALVAVYLPRDRHELEIVLHLILRSCQFAQGRLSAPETR